MRRPYRIVVAISLIALCFGSVAIGGGGAVGKPPVVVVIDAGHGGADPGALGVLSSVEKDITLAVARSVAFQAARYPELCIVLTRLDDRFIELSDRIAKARQVRAVAYVSLHANSAPDATARGVETLVARGAKDAAGSESLASLLQASVCRATAGRDRGVKTATLYTSRATMPAALVEMGFLSEKNDARLLMDPAVQARIASSILEAVYRFVTQNRT